MHFFKKINVITIIIIIIIISILLVIMNKTPQSEENKIIIKNIIVEDKEDLKFLSFDQEININYLISEAIDKGIPLVFKVTLEIVEVNDIWPTKTVLKKIRYYQIEYKALRKVYKIKDINGKNYEYKYLDEAIQKISKVKDFGFSFNNNQVNFELWLNVALERKKLPKPLQVNYFDRTWYMNSNKSIYKFGKLN